MALVPYGFSPEEQMEEEQEQEKKKNKSDSRPSKRAKKGSSKQEQRENPSGRHLSQLVDGLQKVHGGLNDVKKEQLLAWLGRAVLETGLARRIVSKDVQRSPGMAALLAAYEAKMAERGYEHPTPRQILGEGVRPRVEHPSPQALAEAEQRASRKRARDEELEAVREAARASAARQQAPLLPMSQPRPAQLQLHVPYDVPAPRHNPGPNTIRGFQRQPAGSIARGGLLPPMPEQRPAVGAWPVLQRGSQALALEGSALDAQVRATEAGVGAQQRSAVGTPLPEAIKRQRLLTPQEAKLARVAEQRLAGLASRPLVGYGGGGVPDTRPPAQIAAGCPPVRESALERTSRDVPDPVEVAGEHVKRMKGGRPLDGRRPVPKRVQSSDYWRKWSAGQRGTYASLVGYKYGDVRRGTPLGANPFLERLGIRRDPDTGLLTFAEREAKAFGMARGLGGAGQGLHMTQAQRPGRPSWALSLDGSERSREAPRPLLGQRVNPYHNPGSLATA